MTAIEPRIRSIPYLARNAAALAVLEHVADAHDWRHYASPFHDGTGKVIFNVFAPSAEEFDRAYVQVVAADMLARQHAA